MTRQSRKSLHDGLQVRVVVLVRRQVQVFKIDRGGRQAARLQDKAMASSFDVVRIIPSAITTTTTRPESVCCWRRIPKQVVGLLAHQGTRAACLLFEGAGDEGGYEGRDQQSEEREEDLTARRSGLPATL